jgi:hypothetical protein
MAPTMAAHLAVLTVVSLSVWSENMTESHLGYSLDKVLENLSAAEMENPLV